MTTDHPHEAPRLDGATLQYHRAQLEAALEWRYNGCPDDSVITLHTEPEPGGFTSERIINSPANRRQLAHRYGGSTINTWSRISVLKHETRLMEGSRGTERDTWGTTTLHVDIDPNLDEGESHDAWVERTVTSLRNFQPRPSRVESSGRGFYALWSIPWTEDWQRVKRINKWLAHQLGGDHCWDVARLLRLPGTWNNRSGSFAHLRNDIGTGDTYELDEFREADLDRVELQTQDAAIQPEPIPPDFEVRAAQHWPKLWARIQSEATAIDARAPMRSDRSGRVDRSSNDFYIACEMLRRGFSEGQVMTVLTHESWFSGEKWRDSGRNDSYVTYSIIQAQQLVVSEPLSKPPEIATKLSEQYSLLYYLGEWYVYDPDKGFYERGESFLRRAIQAISGPKWTGDLENNSLKYLQPNEEVAELPNTGLINVQNGMLRPETGELVPHGAAYLSLTQVNARWDPTAATSEVDQFVSAVLPQQFVSHWWMFCGYCLYTDVPLPYRCILALVGPRRTGKSTLLNAVQAFLGEYNVSNVPLTDFGGQGNQFTLANLVGKLLNVDSEADYESYLALTNNLKALGSGERVRIEQKYMKGTSMHLPVKLSFAMNGYPRPPHGTDEAFYDRWVILDTKKPDRKAFTMDNPDTLINADRRLLSVPENRNAWLLRSVQGLMELHRAHGFPKLDTTDEFRRQRDSVVAFWQTCTTGGDIIRGTPLSTFYRQYQRWDLEAGGKPVSSHRFRTRSFEIIDEGIVENTMYRLTDRHMVYGRTPAVGMRIGGQEVT